MGSVSCASYPTHTSTSTPPTDTHTHTHLHTPRHSTSTSASTDVQTARERHTHTHASSALEKEALAGMKHMVCGRLLEEQLLEMQTSVHQLCVSLSLRSFFCFFLDITRSYMWYGSFSLSLCILRVVWQDMLLVSSKEIPPPRGGFRFGGFPFWGVSVLGGFRMQSLEEEDPP